MKTATIRDLRNSFASIAKAIEGGESVRITRRGVTFATLAPARAKKAATINWGKRLAAVPAVGRPMTKRETDAFWKALRD